MSFWDTCKRSFDYWLITVTHLTQPHKIGMSQLAQLQTEGLVGVNIAFLL